MTGTPRAAKRKEKYENRKWNSAERQLKRIHKKKGNVTQTQHDRFTATAIAAGWTKRMIDAECARMTVNRSRREVARYGFVEQPMVVA